MNIFTHLCRNLVVAVIGMLFSIHPAAAQKPENNAPLSNQWEEGEWLFIADDNGTSLSFWTDGISDECAFSDYWVMIWGQESSSYRGDVTVPATVFDSNKIYTVTSMTGALSHAYDLTSVTLPQTLTSINDFIGFEGIFKLTIPEGVTSISGISDSHSLRKLQLPSTLTTLQGYSLSNLTSLALLDLGQTGLTTLTDYTGDGLESCRKIILPPSLTSISGAFRNCPALDTIVCTSPIPANIDDLSFSDTDWNNCVLLVPEGGTETYSTASGWNKFRNITSTPAQPYAGVRMIRTDRVWSYSISPEKDNGSYIVDMAFTKQEEHFGTVWWCFEPLTMLPPIFDSSLSYLLREENGRVYVATKPLDYPTYGFEEVLVYDFNVSEGEKFYCHRGPYGLLADKPMTIVEHPEVTIQNEECRVISYKELCEEHQNFANIRVVEGIGVTDFGLLPEMHFYIKSAGHRFATLISVYDDQGQKIFAPSDTGVSEVNSSLIEMLTLSPIYNLFGQRVENPTPGTLYIRDGKKFVAR